MIQDVGAIAASDLERGRLAAAWVRAPGDMAALSVLSYDPMHVPYDRNYHEHDCHYRMNNVMSKNGNEDLQFIPTDFVTVWEFWAQ